MRGGAVAGFAADTEFRPGGVEAIRRGVVALLEIGRVAEGALIVPVLVDPGPMQGIPRRKLAIGIECKPTLAALLFRSRVPGNPERLQSALRHPD